MKKTLLLGCLVALSLSLFGCATAVSSGYGQGGRNIDGRSYDEARVDNQITAAVTAMLVQDKRVPAMGIDVSTFNGVVTLDGHVPNRSAASYAEQIAASVPGVEQVDNRLRVHP
jgi:osmotically-inducible protein OsmY